MTDRELLRQNPDALMGDLNAALRDLSDMFRSRTLDEERIATQLITVRQAQAALSAWMDAQDRYCALRP